MKKLITVKELLDERYGKAGTESRTRFKEEAYTCYVSGILKSRRKELNLTQEELALKIGKHRPYISRIENGEDFRISNLFLLAEALGLKLELSEK